MTGSWWEALVAPVATLLAVAITMAFNLRSQANHLQAEADRAAVARDETAERDDRCRFMAERREAYIEFSSAVDAWMIETQAAKELMDLDEREDVIQRRDAEGLRVRAALNRMTMLSPLHVLSAAGAVNLALQDDDVDDPIGAVQPLLLKFIFECRRDLIGEASWSDDLRAEEVDSDQRRPPAD